MPDILFPSGAGEAAGYLAVPTALRGPATIVLQEWWGLDDHIRSVCDQLATAGFFALAPDLHAEAEGEPGAAQPTMTEQAEREMCAAAGFLASQRGVDSSGVAALGFGLGGGLALRAAATCPQIGAAVIYYALIPGEPDFTDIKGPVLGHFGTADTFISLKTAKGLETDIRSAGVDVTFEKYTGAGHGFFDDSDRQGTYDAQTALISWQRTIGFLRHTLAARARAI